MHPGAQAVHGFSLDMLAQLSGGKVFSDKVDEIMDDFDDKILIIHNSPFDIKFLLSEFTVSKKKKNRKGAFCTMLHFTDICKIPKANGLGYKRPKVSELTSFFDISDQKVLDKAKNLF